MAANRGQGGIQQLLAAEQEAQHIVNAAKSGNFSLLYLDLCTVGCHLYLIPQEYLYGYVFICIQTIFT